MSDLRGAVASGPGGWPVGTDSFFQPRRAAFWLLLVFLANGAYYTFRMFAVGFAVVPVTVLLGLLVWGLYTALFLSGLRMLELLEPLPTSGLVLAFAWGGLGAVYLAVPSNVAIQSLCAKLVSPEFAAVWGAALAGPTTEEFLKLMGVVLLVLVARNQFQTPLPVLAVGAVVGLGFQVVENLSYSVNASLTFPLENQAYPVLLNLASRGFFSGLWSHAAYTTIASAGVAWFLFQPRRPLVVRAGGAVVGLAFAWSLHFAWNSPLLLDVFPGVPGGLMLMLPVKGIPILLAAWLIWRVAQREEGQQLRALAAYFVPERALIRDDEWLRLGSPVQRLAARRAVRRELGRPAGRLKHQLQREQLLLVRQAGVHGRGARTLAHERAIIRIRARLDQLIATQPR